jgi:1,4-dihydroxy-2-naphthoate octaprenyltransferase
MTSNPARASRLQSLRPVRRVAELGSLGIRGDMNAITQKRLNKTLAVLVMLAALVIALLVGLQARAEGKGWFVCIAFGAVAGVMFTYCGILLLGAVVVGVATVGRRMSAIFQKR